jgi:hypothetical protein
MAARATPVPPMPRRRHFRSQRPVPTPVMRVTQVYRASPDLPIYAQPPLRDIERRDLRRCYF